MVRSKKNASDRRGYGTSSCEKRSHLEKLSGCLPNIVRRRANRSEFNSERRVLKTSILSCKYIMRNASFCDLTFLSRWGCVRNDVQTIKIFTQKPIHLYLYLIGGDYYKFL